jgi:hypothetical protein
MSDVKIVGIIFTAMLVWPVIVNAQPGAKFIYFGIDWKADNLDNTLFWTAIILMITTSIASTYEQQRKEKLEVEISKRNNPGI